jgi:hypothetical protein
MKFEVLFDENVLESWLEETVFCAMVIKDVQDD